MDVRFPLIAIAAFSCIACTSAAIGRDSLHRVSFKGMVPIGGINQYFDIDGADDENPVLLYVHGGPGGVETPIIKRLYRELPKAYTVAVWEQRGAGHSNSASIPSDSWTLERFIADTGEAIDYLRDRFHKEKILIVGDSWGGCLSLLAAQRFPEKLDACVALAPAIDLSESVRLSHQAMVERATMEKRADVLKMLDKAKPPFDFSRPKEFDRLMAHMQLVVYYGGYLYGKTSMMPLLSIYSVFDVLKMQDDQKRAFGLLGGQLMDVDLSRRITELEIPVYFGLARHDGNLPPETAVRFFTNLAAPRKELAWFEKSGHMLVFDEPKEVMRLLVETVRPTLDPGTAP
jgi:proline iminopeptidase